jgi:hypothetical protein
MGSNFGGAIMSAAKVQPIRKPKDATPGSTEDLHRLLRYTGTIQGTPLDTAIDDQRSLLWTAQSIIDMVIGALQTHFDEAWPANVPDFPRALREVSRVVGGVANNLESGVLEDRALEIARAGEVDHG